MTRTSSRRALGAAAIVFLAIGLTGVLTRSWLQDLARGAAAEAADGQHDSSQHAQDAASQLHAGADLVAARRLYLDRCSGCTGPRGQGGDMVQIDFADPRPSCA